MAIREALAYCVTEGYERCIVETDSLLMQKIIEGDWRKPWEISTIMEDIKAFMNLSTTKIQHIFKEGNLIADYMANLALEETGPHEYRSFVELPKSGKTRHR